MLTPALLRSAIGCTEADAERFAPHLAEACDAYQIDSPQRLACFFGQIGHESGSLRYVAERWGPTTSQVGYEGRADLGNTRPGDGEKFRGRGLIQTTGRDNARRTTEWLRRFNPPDFEAFPEALEQPRWAALSAAAWWFHHGCNELADQGKVVELGRLINRGNANSDKPANGEADRIARTQAARAALNVPAVAQPPDEATMPAGEAAGWPPESTRQKPDTARTGPGAPGQSSAASTPQEQPMTPIIAAVLPSIIEAIPKLGQLFGSGSKVAERNVKAAETVVQIVQQATGAVNAQDAAERIKADPVARQAATAAVEAKWFDLTEAGGGGIDAARKADAAASAGDMLRSPSFWIALALLPLVYMIVANVIGVLGVPLSDEVRAAISNGVIGMVLGGLVGYYYGQTTSRNRTPAP